MKLIPISQAYKRKNKTLKLFAQIDDEDFDLVNRYTWCIKKHRKIYYARTDYIDNNNTRIKIMMHRLIMKCNKGDNKIIDHIDGNGLNNQKRNLRFATIQQNLFNRTPFGESKYLGVHRVRRKGRLNVRWEARISINYKRIYLGEFKSEEDAGRAYNIAAIKYHGEFARLNKID